MAVTFDSHVTHLTNLPGSRLADENGLSALAIAAAGAIGLSAYGPPVVRSGPKGIVVGLLCHGGHIVLHARPEEGLCLVDIAAAAPASARRGAEVIARRLGSPATTTD